MHKLLSYIKKRKVLFKWMLIYLVVIILLNKYSFIIANGTSMEPTLKDGHIYIVSKQVKVDKLQRYDIVGFKINIGTTYGKTDTYCIKRIVGMPGDIVKISDSYVQIGKCYYPTQTGDITNKTFTLQENEYFLLGDNFKDSLDSRYETIGIIKSSQFTCKVLSR